MSDLATLHHFKFNSDFPADMISYYKTYSFNIPANGSGTKSFNHNLPYTPLTFGVWSRYENFSDSRPCGDGIYGMVLRADATKIYIDYDLSTYSSALTAYLRIYAYAPATYTGYCPQNIDSSTNLILSSDEDYAPLIFEGCFTGKIVQSASQHTDKSYNVKNGYQKHIETCNYVYVYNDLPALPNVMMWREQNGMVQQSGRATFDYYSGWQNMTYPNVSIENKLVTLTLGLPYQQSEVVKAHMRIYA